MKLLVFLLILPAMLSFELQHPTEGSGGCFSGQPLHAYDKEIGDTTTECGLTQGYEAFWSSALVIENKIKNMTVQIVWSVPIAPGALELFLKNTSSDYVMVFMNNWVPDGPPRTSLVSVCLSGCDVTENPNKFVLEKSFAFKGNSSLSNYGQGFFDLAFGFDYATPPTKVESLTNVSITEDSVMLSWNASESTSGGWVERYLVWQDGINIANVSGLFFNVTGLVYDTDYEFTIGALDNFELYGENATPITVRIPSPKQPEVSPPTYSPPAPSFSGGGGGSFLPQLRKHQKKPFRFLKT